MTAPKPLPPRPSLQSLRKQGKQLAREVAAGSLDAIARVRAQLPNFERPPLSRRDAQLVIAREYGYSGWQDLSAVVLERVGNGVEWAAARAQQLIHDNDVQNLKKLLVEYPALLSWRGPAGGGLLASATRAYGDSFDPARERTYTRRECAEALLDAGAVVDASIGEGLIGSRARGLLQVFWSRGLLPPTLRFLAALGDLEGVRACFDGQGRCIEPDSAVNEAFRVACRFEHEPVASFLLERCIALDAALGERIDSGPGRLAFIRYLIEERPLEFFRIATPSPWEAFLMHQVVRSIHDDDLSTFERVLRREPWLLSESCVSFQVGLVERALLRDRGAFIEKLLELAPALLQQRPPPPSQALEFALTYVKPHLLPLLTRIWPLPEDLPHAAGTGNLEQVRRCIDSDTKTQATLDNALAYAVLNHHFAIADLLLEHGADINTRWSSHEPASLLHELVFRDDYEAMQFLIDRGIDMTIVDYRWSATAEGWARVGAGNQKMGDWLVEAERRRSEAAKKG